MKRENQPKNPALTIEQEFQLCQRAIEIEDFCLEELQEMLIQALKELMFQDNKIKETIRQETR